MHFTFYFFPRLIIWLLFYAFQSQIFYEYNIYSAEILYAFQFQTFYEHNTCSFVPKKYLAKHVDKNTIFKAKVATFKIHGLN